MPRTRTPNRRRATRPAPTRAAAALTLEKTPTGIPGFDEITFGGLPKGRPALVCGRAGCGKTLFAMQFLVNGVRRFNEAGVFISFEEPEQDLIKNVASLGFDLPKLMREKMFAIDHVRIVREEIAETGEYDLEGLFIRLDHAIRTVNATRVVLDTTESLFAGLTNAAVLRAELRRLFHWLKDRGVTTVITGEQGEGEMLTRHGLEEFVSDCVVLLDHRIVDQISTRRVRIVKYRGSIHGTNEYPFLIDEDGITVVPITSLGLTHEALDERIGTGIPRLDAMLGGEGYMRGSSILVSGTAGTGKSSVAAHMVDAACRRGERALYFAFEESPSQIVRNMRSIGLDLAQWERKGLLRFVAARPMAFGLEMHLVLMHKVMGDFKPSVVTVDPLSSLLSAGDRDDAHNMVVRLVDFLKVHHVTAMFTSLTGGGENIEQTEIAVSSIVDSWLLLRTIELSGERNRALYILKSRGMAHSNQIREFLITSEGIDLIDVYVGSEGVLTGTARLAQEAREAAEMELRNQDVERRRREFERKRLAVEAQISALRSEIAAGDDEIKQLLAQHQTTRARFLAQREAMGQARGAESGRRAENRTPGRRNGHGRRQQR
jgi:circadian clock protein KaiC